MPDEVVEPAEAVVSEAAVDVVVVVLGMEETVSFAAVGVGVELASVLPNKYTPVIPAATARVVPPTAIKILSCCFMFLYYQPKPETKLKKCKHFGNAGMSTMRDRLLKNWR